MDDVEITEVQFQRFMTLIAKKFREKVKNVEKLLLAWLWKHSDTWR